MKKFYYASGRTNEMCFTSVIILGKQMNMSQIYKGKDYVFYRENR